MTEGIDFKKIDALVLEKYGADPENLIHILQEINAEYTYLPAPAMTRVAKRLNIPLSRVYSVATFYKALSLEPRGRHLISVCTGTACHVRGAGRIMDKLKRDLKIESGATSPDRKFSIEPVRCIGCCGLGPVIRVDEDTHGRLKLDGLSKIIGKYE